MPVGGRRLRSCHRTPWHELPRAVYESHAMSARPEMKAALGRAPRLNPTTLVAWLAWLVVGAAEACAGTRWSATASGGFAFVSSRDGSDVPGGTNLGGWLSVLHAAAPNGSVGVEAGYFTLPALGAYAAVVGGPMGESRSVLSASGAVRWRSPGAIRVHLLGTFGYYDLTHRTKYGGVRPEAVEHEASPGFSLGIGLSGSGPLMPGFQLRWHEVLRPEPNRLDVVPLEAALHFN